MDDAVYLRDYNDVVTAFRDRLNEIGLSMTMLDELSGMPSGYAGKVLGPARAKTAGFMSFFLYAETLGMAVVVVPDLEAVKRMEGRWQKRDELRRRPGVIRKQISPELITKVAAETGRLGGLKPKVFRISSKRRARINRRNAKRGWRKRRDKAAAAIAERRIACT